MYISLALSFIAIASGALLTYTWDEDAPLASRLCTRTCIGFALLGLIGFALALVIGLTTSTLFVTRLLLAAPVHLFRNPGIRDQIDHYIWTAPQAISRSAV